MAEHVDPAPVAAFIARIAFTTCSPAIWTSSVEDPGSSTVHHCLPRASRAGIQFHEKFFSGVTPVPGTSRTGSLVAPARPGLQSSEAASCEAGTESGGPGVSTGA